VWPLPNVAGDYLEAWLESTTLPRGTQESYLEDCLTDCLVPGLGNHRLNSIEDATKYVLSKLPSFIKVSDAFLVSGAVKRIALKLILYTHGSPAPNDGTLAKLVKATKLRDDNLVPLVQLNHVDGKPRVTFVIPEFKDEDTLSKRNLEVLVTLAHYALGVPIENLYLFKDPAQGTELRFDATILKMMEDLSASAATPSGAFAGQDIKIGSYNGNLPTMLATMHLLAIKQSFIRKRTPKKGESVFYVTSQELRSVFNQRSGLQNPRSYGSKVVRALLANVVSVSNKRFPGSWIKSNRDRNHVKSDLGLLSVLGYTEKIPYNHKLQAVIFHDTTVDPKSSLKIRSKFNKDEFKELSFLEFRSAVSLTCNRINPKSEVSFDKQISVEPLACKDAQIVKCYDDSKYFKSIDALHRAHAIMVSCGKSTSKSKPIHYEKARNEFLHSTARNPIKDITGKEYQNIKDLPVPLLEYMCSLYRFKYKPKRSGEEADMEIDSTPPAKKVQASKAMPPPAPVAKKPKAPLKRGRQASIDKAKEAKARAESSSSTRESSQPSMVYNPGGSIWE
jgi:hypothetical protein